MIVSTCCCTTGGTCNLCFSVRRCFNVPLAGATVTATQGGAVVGTCTTDSGGGCCISIPPGDTSWTIEPNATGYNSASGSATYCVSTLCVTIDDCSGTPMPSIVVTWSQGGSSLGTSTATDSSEKVCFSASPLFGPVTASWDSPGAHYLGGSHTFTASGDPPTFGLPTDVTVNATLESGYSCGPTTCCPTGLQSGPPYPVITWPSTFTLNDGIGSVTLTLGTDPLGGHTWWGCALRAVAGGSCGGGDTTSVVYTFACTGAGSWTVKGYADSSGGCYLNNTCATFDGSSPVQVITASGPLTSCSPLSFSQLTDGSQEAAIYGSGGITLGVS